uniref:Putative sulfatase n=1 Tax=uncultured bacterium B26B6 TaxID=1329636 RepID=S4W3X5_9BACT|nr:putative sulfatase [uncultured bacterium B26B6]
MAYDGKVPTWQQRIRDQGHVVTAIGKLHYRSARVDNGFTEEIIPLHIVDEKGALIALLRATPEGMPVRKGHKKIYEESGVGEADYQVYDREITKAAVNWLQNQSKTSKKPWILLVSYASPHPPFKVPQKYWDLYPLDQVPMPVQWRKEEQPQHPATQYLAWLNNFEEDLDEDFVRRVVAGFCGLISVVDDQVGEVMKALKEEGLEDSTRIVYTSDHGEAAGHHGIFGKGNHYEHALGVPLLIAGPGVPKNRIVNQISSHIDLFPTLVEAVGAELAPEDGSLPGVSLWPAIVGESDERIAFAEYHALGARNAGFSLRKGNHKLIFHVGMPRQLFDLQNDPMEENDLMLQGNGESIADALEAELRSIVDPEVVDQQAKKDQLAHTENFGGIEEVRKAGVFSVSPIPGKSVQIEPT